MQHITNKVSYLTVHTKGLYIAEKDKSNLKLNKHEQELQKKGSTNVNKHMKRYSIPLVTREMQFKATMTYYFMSLIWQKLVSPNTKDCLGDGSTGISTYTDEGSVTGATTLEHTLTLASKGENIQTLPSRNPAFKARILGGPSYMHIY